jgi:hypothetical protein
MSSNIIIFGWNRSIPGRERERSNLVIDLNYYLKQKVENGEIQSYQMLFPDNNGGDSNGFFLIYGDNAQLDSLCKSKEWHKHVTHASFHLDELSIVRGTENEVVMKRMHIWNDAVSA